MTPPKESSQHSAEGSSQPLQNESNRDLFTELRAMRRTDGLYDGVQKIPVKAEGEYELPPPAELKISDEAQTLDEIRSEAELPMMSESMSVAERAIHQAGQGESEKTKQSTIDKARKVIQQTGTYAREVHQARSEKRAARAVDREYDDFDSEMDSLRSSIKESDRVRAEAKEDARATAEKEAAAERGRLLAERRKAEDDMWDEAFAELAEFDARKIQDVIDDALMGPSSFEDFVWQEVSKAEEPILAEIRRVEALQSRLMAATERMPVHNRKELEAMYAHELDGLHRNLKEVGRKAREKAKQDQTQLNEGLREQVKGIDEFERDLKADVYTYTPDKNMHPELAALIAGANGAMVGAETNPAYDDEYDIDNGKGNHPTRMQRLVYRTDNPSLYIIEEWDKTSGKLKRQSLVKDANVLVAGKENGAKRLRKARNETELSNRVYQKLGPITSETVKEDSDTSSSDGYNSYVRNLTRSGGVGLDQAKELANPLRPKRKRTQGFIEMLTQNLEKSKSKKK